MIKLSDVAQRAGVSPTTVSRVINKRGYLSNKTKQKVYQAMKDLNYHPNMIARSLTGKTTGLVGIIFANTSNPFFGEMVSKLETRLFEKGYKTILCNSADSPDKERKYVQMLSANKVDGIISGTHNLNISEYDQIEAPIVSFDRNLSTNIPVVSSDNYSGGKKATKFLVEQGCKNIHIITSKLHSTNPTSDRLKAFKDVLSAYHLTPHLHELAFDMNPEIKEMHIKNLLQNESIDGIFCTDDLTAIMVSNVARELNIDIPNQLKIVGYDGTELIQTYFPQLVTIKQPVDEICDLLVRLLVERIHKQNFKKNVHYELPVKLTFSE